MAWQVGPAGITIYNASGRRVAFLAWSEVAWVRVLPLGVVLAAPHPKSEPLRGLVGIGREPARWLRQYSRGSSSSERRTRALHLTGAALLVSRSIMVLQAAPAGELVVSQQQ